jgi:hypothetical protein
MRQQDKNGDRDSGHGMSVFPGTACNLYLWQLSSRQTTKRRRPTMSLRVDDERDRNPNEVSWEIYEIGEPKPYGWSWRCRIADRIVRRSDIMYSTIHEAIEDAVARGMQEPASAIRGSASEASASSENRCDPPT